MNSNRLRYFKKNNILIVLLLLAFNGFSQSYNLTNNATDIGGGCYRLTDAVNNENGAFWYTSKIDLSQPFEINFMAYFGTNDGGADGIIFVLQNDPSGSSATGTTGYDMGFGGISPSVGVEFDTFENSGNSGEISSDHIAIDINGSALNTIAGPVDAIPPPNLWSSAGDIENDTEYPVKITWDPATNLIEVWFNCELRLSTNYDMINNVFGGNSMVYYGYTASTGGLNNLQKICIDDNIFTVQDTVYICQGDSTQLDVTGSPSHTYTWSPATNIDDINSQTPTVWPSVNTTYTVTYDDYCGNQQTDDVVVLISPAPVVDLGADAQICQGGNITLDAGTQDTYLWSSGGTNQTETFTGAGTYSVTVTNTTGCEASDDVVVTELAPPTVSAGSDVSICTGGSTNLTATGTGSFVWSTTETTQSITVSPTTNTTYTVTLTDANSCTNTDDVVVTIGAALIPSITNDTTICSGENITLTAGGGTTYSWDTGDNTSSITVNPSTTTTYNVTVTDGGTCTGTASVTVTVNPAPTVDAGTNQDICNGGNLTLTASGATTYLWSTNETTASINITPTVSAYYYVTGTNASCNDIDSVYVTVNPTPTVDAGNDATICTGGSTNLTATGTGSFVWSTTETTQSITVSPTTNTTYTVTLTDANSCTNTDDVVVTIGAALIPSITNDTTICSGENITLTAGGGTTYSWDTGDNTSSITVNPSTTTTYNVTVTDGGTCTGTASVTVTVNPAPTVDAGTNQNICNGGNLTLTASGATTYLWSTNETTASINITPTVSAYYYVTGTNSGTCFAIDSVYVTVNPTPTVDAGNDATICTGGSASLTATGTGSFVWSTTEITQSITVSPTTNTTYTVTLTDANNCTATDDVVVNVGSSIVASAGNDTTICDGSSVTLTANGGTTYLWSTGEATQSITVDPIVHTNYSVTVTDGTTCSGVDDVNVDINPLPNIDAGVNQTVCSGDNVNLTATGGISYFWSNGSATQSISLSPSASQYYYVTGTDVNSCSADDSVLVNVNSVPVVNLGNDISVCQGSAVDLSVSNTGTYLWSTGETTQSITVNPTTNQTITVVVTDANNCSSSDDININVSGSINISTSADTTACIGNTVNLNASGGVSYSWSTGANTASTSVVVTSSDTYYYVTVSDGGSCSGIDSILVSYYSNPNVDAGNSITICDGDNVVLTATGASQYVWDNGTTNASNSVNPSSTTTYTVTGTDQNGCSASDNVTVSVAGDINLTIMHSPEIVCPGEQVILTTNISGGTPPYTLTLDDGTLISPPLILIPEQTTVVTINATSSSCNSSVTASDTIRVYDVPTPMFTSSVTNGCVPLVVDFNTSNAETGLTYNWDFGNFGNNFSNIKNPTQIYYQDGVFDVTLSLTTQEGCKSSTTINDMITVYPKPNAKFYADPVVVNIIDPVVDFYNISTNNYINYWSFGDGDSSSIVNPTHKFSPNTLGNFSVSLVAVSEYGCKDTAESYIKVEDIATLYVPTAFSPDNDGINDIFKVSAYGIDTDNFDFIIYDRWGEEIFETKDLFTGWDGTYNMKQVETGVYSYVIVYKDFTGIEYTKSGILTLIR